MSEAIRKVDVIQGEPFNDIANEMKAAILVLEKFDTGVKNVAKSLDLVAKESKTTVQGINNITQAEKESAKLVQQKITNDKTLEKMRLEEIRINKAREKSIDDYNKKAAKEEKQARDNANAYKQLERATRDQKNESKRLGAELLKLEADGRKNTKAFKDLERQYRDVTKAAQDGDAQLKKLDKTVGDNFRNVGAYEKGLEGLKSTFLSMGAAIGVGGVVGGVFSLNKELDKATNTSRMFFNTSNEGSRLLAQEAIKVARVYGKDVNEVLAAANTLSKEFGISGEEALNKINIGFAKGGDVQGELIQNVKEYSSQLSYAGLNAEQSIAIITQSQQQGVFSDKGVDAIKEAALSLREMTQPAQDALAAIGMSGDELQKQIQSGRLTYFEAIQQISAKTAEFGQGSREAGMILADVFKGAGEDAGRFIFGLSEMNLELGDMKDASQGMDAAIGNLTSKFYDYIFGVNEAGGVTDKLAYILNFLADNLGTILSVIGKTIRAYVLYRGTMMATAVAQRLFATETGKLSFSLSNMVNNLKGGGEGLNKLKGALKGVGITMFIALFAELATEIYRVGSGAADAERKINNMNNSLELGGKIAGQRIKFLREEVGLGKITEEQAMNDIRNQIKLLNIRREKLKVTIEDFKASERYQSAIAKNPLLRNTTDIGLLAQAEAMRNALYEVDAGLTTYNQELKDMKITQIQATKTSDDLTSSTIKGTKAVDSRVEAERKRLEAEKEALAIEIERSNLEEEAHRRWLDRVQMEIDRDRQMREDLLNDPFGGEDRTDMIEVTPEDFGLPTKEEMKERADMINQIQQGITDALQEQIDKRIELSKKEQDAAKSQQDYLMALAENGNITAKESIAEQIEIQREAQAEQMRLEKQKQNLELISQGLSTFNAQIAEGKSPGEALASTIVSTQALVGFLKNLNFYAKGTDHAPGGMAVVDEKGAEIITDSQGRIKDIGTGEGARFVNLSKGDKVITATKTAQILNAFGGVANASMIGKGKDSAGNGYDIMKLNSGLNRIEQAIKNKPEYQVHWDTFGTVERVRKGGDIVTNRYRVKP